PHFGVALVAQDVADRLCDVGGRERRRRDLVQQWLEEVEVLAIDDRHAHVRSPHRLGEVESPEAAADDDDVRRPIVVRTLAYQFALLPRACRVRALHFGTATWIRRRTRAVPQRADRRRAGSPTGTT